MRFGARVRWLALLGLCAVPVAASAQETVTVDLPGSVTFDVGANQSAVGSPEPTEISFSDAELTPGRALRISVRADSQTFSGPDGSSYPASSVSWSVSNVSGGVGASGTLSSSSYTQVFQSHELSPSGEADITWTFTRTGTERAGSHTLNLRWKLESVQP